MQNSLTRDILEHLTESGKMMVEAFFPRGYAYTEPSRILFGFDRPCRHQFSLKQKASISSILSRLQREELVARDGAKKKSLWRITRKGRGHLRLSTQTEKLAKIEYTLPRKDGKLRMVAFDIPEQQRKKRNWLRVQLIACDFKSLQKSVWVGTRPLPEAFINEIDALNLSSHVHIMSIGEKGTMILQKQS